MEDHPLLEALAARIHDAWMAEKRRQGITSRLSEDGTEQMVPYAQLSESTKALDRAGVRALLATLADEGLAVVPSIRF